jgi:hypothetical protein
MHRDHRRRHPGIVVQHRAIASANPSTCADSPRATRWRSQTDRVPVCP